MLHECEAKVSGEYDGPEVLYHWAPRSVRKSIKKSGLVAGSPARNGLWNPPFVCFATDPWFAFISAIESAKFEGAVDLWCINVSAMDVDENAMFERFKWEDGVEYRLFSSVRAKDVSYVATRKVPLT